VTLRQIAQEVGLEVAAGGNALETEVEGVYVSDIISDVLANTRQGILWITHQRHPNTVAAAVLREVAAVVLANGREPEEETLRKAREEKVTLLASRLPAYELAGRLFSLGLPGVRK
jgi:serine kinase of HPr protein (carbohydrate metabolism regulator)